MDLQAIETKLAAARTRLILDKPFLGALVLRLPMAAADPNWCATTATDARKFYYNPQYIRLAVDVTDPVHAGARGPALRALALCTPTAPHPAPLGPRL